MAAALSYLDNLGDRTRTRRDPVTDMESVLRHLDNVGPNIAFDQVQDIVSDFAFSEEDALSLWERCLDEVPSETVSPNVELLRIRVEYHLNTSSEAIVPLEELVVAHWSTPDVLREAAYMRYLLAERTAKRWYREQEEELEYELEGAKENLKSWMKSTDVSQEIGAWMAFGTSYVDKKGEPQADFLQEITEAGLAVEVVKSRLRKLRRESWHKKYREEVRKALKWALEAQNLDADNLRLCDLVNEIQDEIGVQPFVPDAGVIAGIERFVREDQLEEALAKLFTLEAYQYEANFLAYRFTRIRNQERRGTVTRGEANAEYASIAEDVLDLISS